MLKLNMKTRAKSPVFWVGLLGVIVSPVLAYTGASLTDFTTWESVGNMIVETVKNPYLVGSIISSVLGFLGVLNDPNSKGLSDTERAMGYEAPVANVKQTGTGSDN